VTPWRTCSSDTNGSRPVIREVGVLGVDLPAPVAREDVSDPRPAEPPGVQAHESNDRVIQLGIGEGRGSRPLVLLETRGSRERLADRHPGRCHLRLEVLTIERLSTRTVERLSTRTVERLSTRTARLRSRAIPGPRAHGDRLRDSLRGPDGPFWPHGRRARGIRLRTSQCLKPHPVWRRIPLARPITGTSGSIDAVKRKLGHAPATPPASGRRPARHSRAFAPRA
jgi:hypothetical protein